MLRIIFWKTICTPDLIYALNHIYRGLGLYAEG